MGPRRRRRGRPDLVLPAPRPAMRLQWGHDEGVVEGGWRQREPVRAIPRFNGATTKASWKATATTAGTLWSPMLQWGHDEGVVEGGADGRGGRHQAQASMGPRRRRRGRRFERCRCRRRQLRFNGATTKASWKARSVGDGLPGAASASMGPRRRRRGRLVDVVTLAVIGIASMGPRRRRRGRRHRGGSFRVRYR